MPQGKYLKYYEHFAKLYLNLKDNLNCIHILKKCLVEPEIQPTKREKDTLTKGLIDYFC